MFFSTHPTTLQGFTNRIRRSRVCSSCKYRTYRLVRHQKFKMLFDLWQLVWKFLQYKKFVDFATVEKPRGLCFIHIKHNLFHHNKLARDVDLQNTHRALFHSPHDVMQVSMLKAELGLRSELFGWYRNKTCYPYSDFLHDLSLRIDDGLRYCTNIRSIPPPEFSYHQTIETLKVFGR